MTIQDLINELNALGSIITQHVTGTWEQYNALQEKDEGTLYYITDKNVIYKGDKCYSGVQNVVCVKPQEETSENDKITVTFTLPDGTDESIEIVSHAAMQQHIDKKGSNTVSGHVKLSDATDSQSDVNQGTAATPKAVSEALRLAKEYAEEQIAAGFEASDIQVLKGSVNSKGTINSEDATINGLHISTIANYKTGWSFKVTEKSEGSLWSDDENTKVEAGDTIIALRDCSGSNQTSDWFIVHNNLIGAVTTNSDDLTQDGLIIGDGKQKVKPLANGSNAQVMTIVDGKPQWSGNVDTTYTFADGTDGSFNVTPKGGQTQKVKTGKPANASHADTAVKATHATNADNAAEAIHSETADLADDLGGKPETHEENFVYQPTAADLSIKDGFADIKKLKGNTLVWNQIMKNGNFDSGTNNWELHHVTASVNDNIISVSSSTNDDNYARQYFNGVVNHKYLISGNVYSSDESQINKIVFFGFYGIAYPYYHYSLKSINRWEHFHTIVTAQEGNIYELRLQNSVANTTNKYKNIQLFDLTQMFGEGNEPATVEEFEAMFSNDYYEYNEGELMSFDGNGIKTVGFNQWDEEWVNKGIGASTGEYYNEYRISSANFIKVFPNNKYTIFCKDYPEGTGIATIFFYDSNKTYIGCQDVSNKDSFVVGDDVHYIKFTLFGTIGGTSENNVYNNNICINLSHTGYRDGEYQPYEEHTTQWYNGKKISELTSNGEVIFPDGLLSTGSVFDEITKDSNGNTIAIKRIGSVDMGSLNWFETDSNDTNKKRFGSQFNDIKNASYSNIKGNILTNKYITVTADSTYLCVNGISLHTKNVIIYDENYDTSTLDTFKASLQGQILYYELAEPITYILDENINLSYNVRDFGTEEVLYSDSEVNIPMKADIKYGFNAVDMIRSNYFDIKKLKKDYLPSGGIAASAEKLATPRSFKISGGAESGAVEFDGTNDVNLNVIKVKSSVIDWEGITNITDKNIVNTINYTSPSKTNIPNEYAVAEAVMGIIDLLTWKTL